MPLRPDVIDKDRKVDLVLDGAWHHFDFKVGGVIVPSYKPVPGTYLLVDSLLGEVDEANHPDTDLNLNVQRWGSNGPDPADNGTAWDYAHLDRDRLVTRTWSFTGVAKIVIATTGDNARGVGIDYRGEGGAAFVEQRLLKFLRQRDS